MYDLLFVSLLGFVLAHLLGWGFKYLPGERWQMMAVVPLKKGGEGDNWLGINVTYYGFFIATSQLISLSLLLVLLSAAHISLTGAMLATLVILTFCVPASRIIAILVEKKRHTFTVGGASFVGILLAPWIITAIGQLVSFENLNLPMIPILAAMSIAYTLGEGLGRLGCISYGCCYGKPVKNCHPFFQFLFSRISVVFYGSTKKVAYEGCLSGEKLIPIQAITCVFYTLGALLGTYVYLKGYWTEALIFTMMLTQLWRILSEAFRADFRGFGRISTYQKMGLIAVVYILAVVHFAAAYKGIDPDVVRGLRTLWNPGIIVGLQLLWMVFFFTFGRSTVTRSTVSFQLIRERI